MNQHAREPRTWLLPIVIAVQSILLSLPAAIYLLRFLELPNLLSLLLTFGFFATLFTLMRSLALQLLVGIPVLALNMIEIVHIAAFGGLVSLGGLEAILYVNPAEAREFAGDHAGLIALALGVFATFIALAWVRSRCPAIAAHTKIKIAAGAVGLPVALLAADLAFYGSARNVYLPTRVAEHFVTFLGVNPLTHTISGLAETLATRREMAALRAQREGFVFDASLRAGAPARATYIVVVGESSRRANWQIYGYPRPTNPRLSGMENLYAFTDALSPATTTSRSLPLSFSPAAPGDLASFYRTKSFITAFREAGFKTFFVSNQGSGTAAVGSELELIMAEADEVRSTNFGYWNSVLDEATLPQIDDILADSAPRKLIVVHTLGSHTNYGQRYPKGWDGGLAAVPVDAVPHAVALDADQLKTIDDYDHTVAYTDWLLGEIIERHRRTGTDGAVVYFSDHGQRLYDDSGYQKGHGFGSFKPQDAEIPFLAWLPEPFLHRAPDVAAALAQNVGKPVSTGTLCASLLDLAGIETSHVDPADSVFSPRFRPRERKILLTSDVIVSR